MDLRIGYYQSPIGLIEIQGAYEFVYSIKFIEDDDKVPVTDPDPSGAVLQCIRQLDQYFKGKLRKFDFPVRRNGTSFQQRVWDVLEKIPYGETINYHQLAERLGNEKVIRASAHANAKNQLAIVVPCHRVIGSDGSLVGYMAGLKRKQWLLDHEAKVAGKYNKLF